MRAERVSGARARAAARRANKPGAFLFAGEPQTQAAELLEAAEPLIARLQKLGGKRHNVWQERSITLSKAGLGWEPKAAQGAGLGVHIKQ